MNTYKSLFLLLFMLVLSCPLPAQYTMGMSGLLTISSADMQPDGTFMVGGNYLSESMLHESFGGNSGNYFLSLTFLPFIEMGYRCTLLKDERLDNWQQDRSVSLRLRALKERKYVPSVVVGSNDVFTTYGLNPFSNKGGNSYFASVYGVATKNLPLGGHQLGFTFGYYFPIAKTRTDPGLFGGIRYVPAFCPQMEVMMDYNRKDLSVGASCFLWKHLRLHLLVNGFKAISGGVRYEFILIPHKS